MTRPTRLSAEAQVVADELALLRNLGMRRRRASWMMVLDRQAFIGAVLERRRSKGKGGEPGLGSRTANAPFRLGAR
jgi:hypothetical protein